jgi:hypothetical protein
MGYPESFGKERNRVMTFLFKLLFPNYNFKTEKELFEYKVRDFMRTVGCSENEAKLVMQRRKLYSKEFQGEKDWRMYYE